MQDRIGKARCSQRVKFFVILCLAGNMRALAGDTAGFQGTLFVRSSGEEEDVAATSIQIGGSNWEFTSLRSPRKRPHPSASLQRIFVLRPCSTVKIALPLKDGG